MRGDAIDDSMEVPIENGLGLNVRANANADFFGAVEREGARYHWPCQSNQLRDRVPVHGRAESGWLDDHTT